MKDRTTNPNLNTRLLGYSLSAVATLTGMSQSEAQVIGESINKNLNAHGETYGVVTFPFVPSPNSNDKKFQFRFFNIPSEAGFISTLIAGAGFIKNSGSNYQPKALADGYSVKFGRRFTAGSQLIGAGYYNNGFFGQGPKYIGIRFKNGSDTHYGWIKVNLSSSGLVVMSYAYETTSGVQIICDGILPVELTSFTAASKGNTVSLVWNTATEVNNYGFEIERNTYPDFENGSTQTNEWQKIGFIQGAGNSNSPKDYKFTDPYPPSGLVMYRLKQIDNDGKFAYSDISTVEISKPANFDLGQNYPNPFNPTTAIRYSIPNDVKVSLTVYDMLGSEVATLVNETQTAGKYKVDFNGANLPSGTYMYKLIAGEFSQSKKLLLIK